MIDIRRVSPSTGVPVIVKPVIVAVCAVIWQTSYKSVFIAGVAEFAEREVTRFVIRLFVSVFAADIVSTTTHSTAITPAEDRVIVVSEAFHTSS